MNNVCQNCVKYNNQKILAEMAKSGVPSLASCIIKEDQIVWQGYYGFSDIAEQIPPTDETIYILASISKAMTATAAMQLWERVELDLDRDIDVYLSFEIRNRRYSEILSQHAFC